MQEVNVSKNSKSYDCTPHPSHGQIPLKLICEMSLVSNFVTSHWKES